MLLLPDPPQYRTHTCKNRFDAAPCTMTLNIFI
jgi:hypothetical protein